MKEAPRFGTQGGGMVIEAVKRMDGGRGSYVFGYVFISDPPDGFEIGDWMPSEWGLVGPFDKSGKPLPEPDFGD